MTSENQANEQVPAENAVAGESGESVQGRGVFVVETIAAGIAVHTAFAADDNRLFRAPAVFRDIGYALAQIDEMRALVIQHFSRAAQIGAQVISRQEQG